MTGIIFQALPTQIDTTIAFIYRILHRDSVTYAPLQYLSRFAVVIFTPLQATMDVDGAYYWCRCKHINGL
jgi:hypothetical protein